MDLDEKDQGKLLLGDNSKCKVRGIGKVNLSLNDGLETLLTNVRFVLEIKRNLISIGMLLFKIIKIESGKMKVSKGFLVLLKAVK